MRWNLKLFTAILAVTSISLVSQAQVTVVGTEDFSSYPLGAWTDGAASPYVFGGATGTSNDATIVDSGTARGQELRVDLDLFGDGVNANYNSGFQFGMDMSGNLSYDINDYEMEMYFHIDPATLASLSVAGSGGVSNFPQCVLTLYNPNDGKEGTEYDIDGTLNYDNAITNGAVLSYVFSPENVYTRYDKTEHLQADISKWRVDINYGFGGTWGIVNPQPITIIADEFVVRYKTPGMVNPDGAPKGYQSTNDLTVSGITLDGTNQVDIMELHLDGTIVNTVSNMAADTASVTNLITYDALGLDPGVHTAAVKTWDQTGTNSLWYSWTFYCAGPPSPAETNPIGVYNINIGGTDGGNAKYYWPLPNGFVAAAPVLGANNWLNVDYNNPWWFGNKKYQVSESSGSGSMGDIEYEMLQSSANIASYAILNWDGFHAQFESFQLACPSNCIWGGALAGPGTDNNPNSGNMDFELRNLESDLTYDLYLYFVTQGDTAGTQTVYTLTSGYAPTMTASLTGDESSVWSNQSVVVNTYIEGTNYTAITDITPVDGVIAFNLMAPQGGSAGLSALQLVARTPVISDFSIQSLEMSGATVDLSWESQKYLTYDIFGKSDLIGSWSVVSNDIPSAGNDTNLTVSIPASGDTEEFFKVEAK